MKLPISALALSLVVICSDPAIDAQKKGAAPCLQEVAPFRSFKLKMVYKTSFSYHVKDEPEARQYVADELQGVLNDKGKEDGNTFVVADGVVPNFTIDISISNDGTDHYSAAGTLSGWGQGLISTISSGPNYYATSSGLISGLAADIYNWIHGGWHDKRPECRLVTPPTQAFGPI
jgi:hypothetical protein